MVLFPNPVLHTLAVRFGTLSDPAAISIYDLTGSLVLKDSHCISPCHIDVGSLAAGVYLLDAEFKRGRRATRHFVVSR